MSCKSYHDVEIVGILHKQDTQQLVLTLDNGEESLFENILHFEFSPFSKQNVIFDIAEFDCKALQKSELVDMYW